MYRTGNYEMNEAEGVQKGTKIVIHLKKDCWRFAMEADVKGRSLCNINSDKLIDVNHHSLPI